MLQAELPTPLDLSWPKSFKDRVVYVIRAPILFALHITLSDVRKPVRLQSRLNHHILTVHDGICPLWVSSLIFIFRSEQTPKIPVDVLRINPMDCHLFIFHGMVG